MSIWDKEQEALGIPLIERTYKVLKPNDEQVEINRFVFNLAMCANPETWVQCSDNCWIPAKRLKIIA